mgnify:CR=1 FL=1
MAPPPPRRVLPRPWVAVRMVLPRGEARYRFGMGILVALAVCPLLTAWRLLDVMPSAIEVATDVVTPLTAIGTGATDDAWAWGRWANSVAASSMKQAACTRRWRPRATA